MIPIGFSLQPDVEFMGLLEGVLRESVDYYEVAPETLWRVGNDGALGPNGFHRRFADLGRENDKPFVAHGVGFSVGSSGHADASRRKRWLDRLSEDHRTFRFQWYTDHLGASSLADLAMTLPIAIPGTPYAAG